MWLTRRPVISGDVKAGNTRHLLQILYSLRVAKLSPMMIDASGLREALETVVAEGTSPVSEEASLLLSRMGAKKRSTKEEGAGRQAAEKTPEITPLSDEQTYELPHWEEEPKRVEIKLPIYHWGIKYHLKDALLYVRGKNAIYVLYGSSLQVQPSDAYRVFFQKPRLLFECCLASFSGIRALCDGNQPITYIAMLDQIWTNARSEAVVVTEEDLIVNYPLIQSEMNSLDKLHGFAANVNVFGMNDFMSSLEARNAIWTAKNEKKESIYGLENELEVPYYRAEQLLPDADLLQRVNAGELPRVSSDAYPATVTMEELDDRELR